MTVSTKAEFYGCLWLQIWLEYLMFNCECVGLSHCNGGLSGPSWRREETRNLVQNKTSQS